MFKRFLNMIMAKGVYIGFKIPFNKPKRRYKPKHDWEWCDIRNASSMILRCTRCKRKLTNKNRRMGCDG